MQRLEYGMEIEFFVRDSDGNLVYPADAGLGHDDLPLLAELRSRAHDDIYLVVAEIISELHRTRKRLEKKGFVMDFSPRVKLDKKQYDELLRRDEFSKGRRQYENLYGKVAPLGLGWVTAGVHLHFSVGGVTYRYSVDVRECKGDPKCRKDKEYETYDQIDYAQIIRILDDHYKKEIKEAKRVKGMYELKEHGFEYRSLPNTIDLLKLAEFITDTF